MTTLAANDGVAAHLVCSLPQPHRSCWRIGTALASPTWHHLGPASWTPGCGHESTARKHLAS